MLRSSSIDMCVPVPLPPEPYVNLPARAFASAMKSFMVVAGSAGLTTRTLLVVATSPTGATCTNVAPPFSSAARICWWSAFADHGPAGNCKPFDLDLVGGDIGERRQR